METESLASSEFARCFHFVFLPGDGKQSANHASFAHLSFSAVLLERRTESCALHCLYTQV